MVRTGIGYDVHGLEKGGPLVLGGVKIPFEKKAVGHSDGDVLCHAVVDALLGAANLGDIGHHFPSGDDRWKGTSSLVFLESAGKAVRERGFEILNVDCTVILQEPRIDVYVSEIRSLMKGALGIRADQISVKGTTTDFLGYIGQGEGIGAVAVASISSGP